MLSHTLPPFALAQECIVTNLLSQKKEIKRQTLLLEKMKEEEEAERQLARQQARERVLADFEKLQNGAGPSSLTSTSTNPSTTRIGGSSTSATPSTSASTPSETNAASTTTTSTIGGNERGLKRKFALDDTEVSRLQEEQEEQAMKLIEQEQLEKRKAKLPNFWLPSLTPDAGPTKLSEVKLQSLCHAGDPAHPIR